jgi:2-polyprenyl-6-methoxyphenol hydroxylase-like FAD-dependent oxidoreductase
VKPFLQINNNTVSSHDSKHRSQVNRRQITGGTGHVGFMSHKQPELEKHLRDAMDKKYAELRGGTTMTKVSEDDKNVHVTYQTADAKMHRIRAKFLVGADGKTGFVRKNYLEAKGVLMEKSSKSVFVRSSSMFAH